MRGGGAVGEIRRRGIGCKRREGERDRGIGVMDGGVEGWVIKEGGGEIEAG